MTSLKRQLLPPLTETIGKATGLGMWAGFGQQPSYCLFRYRQGLTRSDILFCCASLVLWKEMLILVFQLL